MMVIKSLVCEARGTTTYLRPGSTVDNDVPFLLLPLVLFRGYDLFLFFF